MEIDLKHLPTSRHTIWKVDERTHEKIRKLYTGTYDECCTAIEWLLVDFSIDSLGMVNHDTERFVSF